MTRGEPVRPLGIVGNWTQLELVGLFWMLMHWCSVAVKGRSHDAFEEYWRAAKTVRTLMFTE